MYSNINFSEFCDGFRGDYKDGFSYEGKLALFDYLENYEKETGEEIEFDPIALCCEYDEYESLEEIIVHYPNVKDLEELKDQTTVIEIEGGKKGYIIASY